MFDSVESGMVGMGDGRTRTHQLTRAWACTAAAEQLVRTRTSTSCTAAAEQLLRGRSPAAHVVSSSRQAARAGKGRRDEPGRDETDLGKLKNAGDGTDGTASRIDRRLVQILGGLCRVS